MSKKSAAAKSEFPKTIFVRQEDDGDGGTFLTADPSHESAEDSERVAVYELREVKTKRVMHELA